jgi:hypothetical protein
MNFILNFVQAYIAYFQVPLNPVMKVNTHAYDRIPGWYLEILPFEPNIHVCSLSRLTCYLTRCYNLRTLNNN